VVKTSPGFGNGGGVGKHTYCTLDLSEVTSWDNGWWLVVDTDFETGWAPVNKLNGSFGFDGSN
jgi:CO dehydrogenase nickel-insertion accessory protein CooC1